GRAPTGEVLEKASTAGLSVPLLVGPGSFCPFRKHRGYRIRGFSPQFAHQAARRPTAAKHNELSPLHSITSSARASSEGGIVRPSAFAVWRKADRCVRFQRRGGRGTLVPSLVTHHFDWLAWTPGDSILSFLHRRGGGIRGVAHVQGHWDVQQKAAGLHFLFPERF